MAIGIGIANAHYVIGKAYLIDGILNFIAYSFLQALCVKRCAS